MCNRNKAVGVMGRITRKIKVWVAILYKPQK